jgi:hypothetical protein
VVVRLLVREGLIARGPDGPDGWQSLLIYPVSSVVSGLAFFVMGCNYWGRFYAVGAAFWVLALLMPLHLSWAPLEFGLLWSGVLVVLGLHLRRLGRQAQADRQAAGLPPSAVPTVLQREGDGVPGAGS